MVCSRLLFCLQRGWIAQLRYTAPDRSGPQVLHVTTNTELHRYCSTKLNSAMAAECLVKGSSEHTHMVQSGHTWVIFPWTKLAVSSCSAATCHCEQRPSAEQSRNPLNGMKLHCFHRLDLQTSADLSLTQQTRLGCTTMPYSNSAIYTSCYLEHACMHRMWQMCFFFLLYSSYCLQRHPLHIGFKLSEHLLSPL